MKPVNSIILETRNLTKKFGGLVAVNDVNVSLERGICKGLIGPNGSGKTTLFNLICKAVKPTTGKVFFKGKDITKLPPHEISKMGIGRSYQVTNIFFRLPVLENVRIAVQSRRKINHNFYSNVDEFDECRQKALEILAMIGLGGRENFVASALTPGDVRKLELAIALATEPELLLLDEPTAGVSIEEVPSMIDIVKKIKHPDRLTILLIEHKIDVIMDICDSIFVMHRGSIIADGTPQEIANNELVQTIYFGGA
jgi:branched-chain amino acid transport system ATP-binding protein